MKNINKIILGLLAVSMAIVSCEENDKDPLNVHTTDANKAAYVRAVVNQVVYLVEDIADATFEAKIDVPVDNVAEYSLAFTLISGTAEYDTIPLDIITTFPTDISYTYEELTGFLGITTADISGGNIFQFIGTCTGKDGRTWTVDNYTGDITGQVAQYNGFSFTVLVDCAPITDVETAGTWVADLQDTYGDGWDGAFLTFSINGSTTAYTISAAQATDASYDIDVPAGALLEIFYTSGNFEGEHIYQLYSPDGALYGDYGPAPGKCVN